MSAEGDCSITAFGVLNLSLENHSWSAYVKTFLSTLFASVLLMSGAHSQGSDILGEWNGTWQSGGTSGTFNLNLEQTPAGMLVGYIVISTNGAKEQLYGVDLRDITFDGNLFSAVFPEPGTTSTTVTMSGLLNSGTGHGTWSARNISGAAGDSVPETGSYDLVKQVD